MAASRFAEFEETETAPKGAPVKKPVSKGTAKKPSRFAEFETPAAKPAKPVQRDYAAGEVLPAAWRSARKSVEKLGQGVQGFYNAPAGETVYKGVTLGGNILQGAANLAGGAYLGLLPDGGEQVAQAAPGVARPMQAAPSAVAQHYGRYTTHQGRMNAFAEDPFGVAADVASVAMLPAGGGVTAAGRIGQAAAAVGRGAARVLPAAATNTARIAAPGVRGAGRVIRRVMVPSQAALEGANYATNSMIPWAARKATDIRHPENRMITHASEGQGARAMQTPMTPRMAALHRQAQAKLPQEAEVINNAWNTRILDDLRGLSSAPDVPFQQRMTNLATTRETNRRRMYGLSNPIMSETNERLFDILNLPLNINNGGRNNVLDRARRLAAADEQPFGVGAYTPDSRAPYSRLSGQDLDLVKKAFDDIASTGRTAEGGGLGPAELVTLGGVRRKFLDWVDDSDQGNNKAYAAARQQFEDDSRAMARERIINKLEETLTSSLNEEFTPKLRAEQFSNLLRSDLSDLPGNTRVNKITGGNYINRLDEVFTPDEMTRIREIENRLHEMSIQDSNAVAGARDYGNTLDTGFSDAVGTLPTRWWSQGPISEVSRQMSERIAPRMLTPEGRAGLSQNAMLQEADIARIYGRYNWATNTDTWNPFDSPNTYNPARLAARYPTTFNAYGAMREDEQNAMNR